MQNTWLGRIKIYWQLRFVSQATVTIAKAKEHNIAFRNVVMKYHGEGYDSTIFLNELYMPLLIT